MRRQAVGVRAVSHADFRRFAEADTAILRVGRGRELRFAPSFHFLPEVAAHFRAEYPDVALGVFDREQDADLEWLARQLRDALPADDGHVPDGYFLRWQARWVAFHGGRALPESEEPLLILLAGFEKKAEQDRRNAAAVIKAFEAQIATPPVRSVPRQPVRSPSRARKPYNPFAALPVDVSYADAKAVKNEALLKNHTDRVAGLDLEIQKVAGERTVDINLAWAALCAKRGWK